MLLPANVGQVTLDATFLGDSFDMWKRTAREMLLLGLGVALLAVVLTGGMRLTAQVAGPPETPDASDRQDKASGRQVEALLVEENFDELDRIADKFRRDKTRSKGGDWRLREFYVELDAPQLTDKDSIDHLAHLANWMTKRPESITARVAMATSLTRWAWVARGNGGAQTVTPEGWRLFTERAQKALLILENSRDMKQMCPQWYSEMMTVGLALNWDERKVKENFARGIQFEPEYFYLYEQYANYLLPKWHGQAGQAAEFAKTSADKVGGTDGDLLYFQIARALIRRGSRNKDANGNASVNEVDWERIQRGYQAATSQYGLSPKNANELALMAYIYRDHVVAQRQFALIGDGWSHGVWKDRQFFDRARDWAGGRAGTSD